MYNYLCLKNLDDYFTNCNLRNLKGVFFYRINGYNEDIKEFIKKYYQAAIKNGIVIEKKMPNPNEKNLEYYNEIVGSSFEMNVNFIKLSLKKWIPRLNNVQIEDISISIYNILNIFLKDGKNINILKNIYIKFMCWLYYKFERMLNNLGNNKLPKILYEGNITSHELMFLSVLAKSGCDVLLLQYNGDAQYLKIDSKSIFSKLFAADDLLPFPNNFSIRNISKEIETDKEINSAAGDNSLISNCTNKWISKNPINDILKSINQRGSDNNLYYNCFIRVLGVEDKSTYLSSLFKMYTQLKNENRNVVVVNKYIETPTVDEISKINRLNYSNIEQMLIHISKNIIFYNNIELQNLVRKKFIKLMMEENKKNEYTINKLVNKVVYLLCWFNRYSEDLFKNFKKGDISVFILFGNCESYAEILFLKFLATLPIDVLILTPNVSKVSVLDDELLFEKKNNISMNFDKFPKESTDLRIGTNAYYAEQDLKDILYDNTGLYLNHQYSKASTISLQTIYEEISILWNEEAKYRPNFSVINNSVMIPVIFSKVSGIKDNNKVLYWQNIKKLINSNTYVVKKAPIIKENDFNPIKQHAPTFIKNKKLLVQKIISHSSYQYAYLRDEIQEYIFEKLQLLIDKQIIRSSYADYIIISTVLNIDKKILQLIQKFDFTKDIPKIICINTTETLYSLEDSILMAFLNLVGFDILFFVPTGYKSIEKYFNFNILEEHKIGEYVYDMTVPNSISVSKKLSLKDILFGR